MYQVRKRLRTRIREEIAEPIEFPCSLQIQRKLRVPGMVVSERTMQMQRSFLIMQLLQA